MEHKKDKLIFCINQRRTGMVAILLAVALLTGKIAYMQEKRPGAEAVYQVNQLQQSLTVDGNWDKPVWQNAQVVNIKHHMGDKPRFVPEVNARMMYDKENLYVIFRVRDQFVKSTVTKINGPVSENSCVEFFFAPDTAHPLHYFNLEINAGGTPLMFFITKPWSGYKELDEEDIKTIEISHSLPSVVDPELKEPVTWTIECRIPLAMLRKYSPLTTPAAGVEWKGNFYKTGSETSNPNYMTWSVVEHPKPNFHLPQYFGKLQFR